jgi:hypothetical protein
MINRQLTNCFSYTEDSQTRNLMHITPQNNTDNIQFQNVTRNTHMQTIARKILKFTTKQILSFWQAFL